MAEAPGLLVIVCAAHVRVGRGRRDGRWRSPSFREALLVQAMFENRLDALVTHTIPTV